MEAQYASEYPAGDCELYGDVASGMRKEEWKNSIPLNHCFSSNLYNRIADNLYA